MRRRPCPTRRRSLISSAVRRRTGEYPPARLLLPGGFEPRSVDVRATPVVGVWFNNFGFPAGDAVPFRCIAVEPCTSPSDLLDDLPAHAYPCVPAGGSAAWSLGLEISTADWERSTQA